MSNDDSRKQAGIARLASDLRAAKIELLSAQCATDRLRLQYSMADIVSLANVGSNGRDRLCRRTVPFLFFR